ncbi:MAG TPA: flagellar M-ring protein FliF [Candidatus Latescibacteria bacterium]|nr:flagellar M-ring protein FliF [Candidatus Latescibacterota bacterium]
MGEFLKQLSGRIREVWGRLSVTQKIVCGALLLVGVVGLVLLMVWTTRPEYALLYANLSQEDSEQITGKLKDRGIPYQFSRGGTAVLVPSEKVYELRMEFASQGIPQMGGVGYELFDKTNLGMSEFVQKVNYQRAVEGELARTIQGMLEVQQVRVHLVLPKERLFAEDQEEATASITLLLRPGAELRRRQVRGIAYLVASSVEGLSPENVTIVDFYGNILSTDLDKDPTVGLSSSQLELQRNVELYLADKAQTMLTQVLGRGNAVVRVSAELNFERVERTRERYDPENTVVLSEEIEETSDPSRTGGSGTETPGRAEHTITNYQISKTVEHLVNTVGNLRRLSVAVLVNGVSQTEPDSGAEQGYIPRSADEMARLAAIVKGAVGFDAGRGDQIEIHSVPFDTSQMDRERALLRKAGQREFWTALLKRIGIGVLLVVLLMLLRSRLRKVEVIGPLLEGGELAEGRRGISVEGRERAAALPGGVPGIAEGMTPEVLREQQVQEQVAEFVQEQPSKAAGLLKAWLLEG